MPARFGQTVAGFVPESLPNHAVNILRLISGSPPAPIAILRSASGLPGINTSSPLSPGLHPTSIFSRAEEKTDQGGLEKIFRATLVGLSGTLFYLSATEFFYTAYLAFISGKP